MNGKDGKKVRMRNAKSESSSNERVRLLKDERGGGEDHVCVIGAPKQHCTSFHKCSVSSTSSALPSRCAVYSGGAAAESVISLSPPLASDRAPSPFPSLNFHNDRLEACMPTSYSSNKAPTSAVTSTAIQRCFCDRGEEIFQSLPKYVIMNQLNRLSADIAAANPDMVHFQQVINNWVCGDSLLHDAVNCGDAAVLYDLLPTNVSRNEFIADQKQKNNSSENLHVHIDINKLNEEFRGKLNAIVDSYNEGKEEKVQRDESFCGTLFVLRARCDFVAGLFMIHQNARTTTSERSALIPHLYMITALLSIVANVEEQKRLARQSEIFLSMAQNVFSSILRSRRNSHPTLLYKKTMQASEQQLESRICARHGKTTNDDSSIVANASPLDRQTLILQAVTSSRTSESESSNCSFASTRAKSLSSKSSLISPTNCVSPDVCNRLLSLSEDMNLLVRNITKEAKTLVHAETCSLFLLDRENSELVAEVFEKNGSSDEYLTEIRMPISKGIVGHVAQTGQMMNVKDVYNHPFFYPKVDERTGFVTRNILCFPIKDSSGNLVGVAELCNKIGKPSFTNHDEQIALTFSVYCAISISHCLLYRKLQEAHRRSHMAAELLVQGSTLSIAAEDILRLTVRDIPSTTSYHPEFTCFIFPPRSIGCGDSYVEASLSIFKELGFIDRFRIRRQTLARFLLMVQKGYRDVPYHNWSHAFAVAHFCFLLVRTATIQKALSELERLSLFVACLCHDIDHRGTTNAFQLQSKTPLAQLYSSEGSVLERHHFAQTVSILSMEECNIFDQLTRNQYQLVLDNIREIILATDIAAHLRKVTRIKKMAEDGYNSSQAEHHYLLICLLMTASDLSDQTKNFKNSKAIAENIYKEFFSQGDLEKQMGNCPIEMMDRDRACVPKIQLEFMDTVALPVFEYLSKILPDAEGTYNSILLNRKCWQALAQIIKEEQTPIGGLEYLRSEDLEDKVMKRISSVK